MKNNKLTAIYTAFMLICMCINVTFAQKKKILSKESDIKTGLSDSIFDDKLYREANDAGIIWSSDDEKILVRVQYYNTIIKHFDTSLLLKPIFVIQHNKNVSSHAVLFQNKPIAITKSICEGGYVVNVKKAVKNDPGLERTNEYSLYYMDFGKYIDAEKVGIHYIYDPNTPKLLKVEYYENDVFPVPIKTDTLHRKW